MTQSFVNFFTNKNSERDICFTTIDNKGNIHHEVWPGVFWDDENPIYDYYRELMAT